MLRFLIRDRGKPRSRRESRLLDAAKLQVKAYGAIFGPTAIVAYMVRYGLSIAPSGCRLLITPARRPYRLVYSESW